MIRVTAYLFVFFLLFLSYSCLSNERIDLPDEDIRLTKISGYDVTTGNLVRYKIIEYDNRTNKIIKSRYYQKVGNNFLLGKIIKIEYNDNEEIKKVEEFNSNENETKLITFNYIDGRIDSTLEYDFDNNVLGRVEYIYDGEGRVDRAEVYKDNTPDPYTLEIVYTYTYSSAGLLIKRRMEKGANVEEYEYVYDSSNLLIQSLFYYIAGTSTHTLDYFYEYGGYFPLKQYTDYHLDEYYYYEGHWY